MQFPSIRSRASFSRVKLWTFFLEFSGKNCKTMQNHQTFPKSAEISFIIWIQLISFWGMSCVFLCILVCMCVKCIFASLCIFVETFVRAWLSQAFLAFWSCPQYHVRPFWPFGHVLNIVLCFYAFVFDVWYWNKVWYDDDIWYDRDVNRFLGATSSAASNDIFVFVVDAQLCHVIWGKNNVFVRGL